MKPKELDLINYNSMVSAFHSESDRGAAVLAGSYVENVLGKLLIFQMKNRTSLDDLFGSNGPFSTFSQRIAVARAFGFITQDMAETLDYIRKISNHFAHHPLDASFELSPVKDWIEKMRALLKLAEEQEEVRSDMKHRIVYLISCGFFSASMHLKIGRPSPNA